MSITSETPLAYNHQNPGLVVLYKLTLLTLTALLVCIPMVEGQDVISDSVKGTHSKIEHMTDRVLVRLVQSSDIETFGVRTETSKIRLSPNAITVSSLSFNYRFISFAVHYVPRFIPGNDDDYRKGKTKSGGFSLGFNQGRWFNNISYGRTRGYYLENTSDYVPAFDESKPYIQFPRLKFTQFKFVTAFNFNPQFSMSAVTFQTERQIRSAGSFIPQLRLRYYINNDETPQPPGGYNQKANNLEVLIGAGYHYTFVIKKRFYLAAGLTPNIGYLYSRIKSTSSSQRLAGNQSNLILRIDGRMGAGYSDRRFVAGFYTNLAESAYRQQHTTVITNNDNVAFQFFVGYRFNAPKYLKYVVDLAAQKAGMH